MLIWLIFAILTAIVMLVVLSPFYGERDRARSRNAFDREVYLDQLKEIDADLARGVLGEADAESARIEISRRLIASKDPGHDGRAAVVGEHNAWTANPEYSVLVNG